MYIFVSKIKYFSVFLFYLHKYSYLCKKLLTTNLNQ